LAESAPGRPKRVPFSCAMLCADNVGRCPGLA
jgi:hypothetical protein